MHPKPSPPEGTPAPGPAERSELERVCARDEDALGAFFDRHFSRIYSLACRLLSDVHDAEDVTQEVFFRVHRAADRMDPTRDPVPWLMAITYNACRDLWRSKGHRARRQSLSLDAENGLRNGIAASAGADPESMALKAETERQVQEAIDGLPEGLRVVVLMHDYSGLTHEEIAAATGLTHVAVRKRYSRALSELGRRLQGVGR